MLAEAYRVDEVKTVRDKWVAMQGDARQAKDAELLRHATEICLRAEGRASELVAEMEKNTGTRSQLRGDVPVGGRAAKPPTDETPTLADLGLTKTQSSKWQQLAALSDEKFEIRVEHAKARVEGMTTSAPACHRPFVGENEWFTPDDYLSAAREVLGGIDLDPATHAIAQARIRASKFFTAVDDGPAHPWRGRVWLNPPYARGLIDAFVLKLIDEVQAGQVSTAILLVHNYTDSAWLHAAVEACRVFRLLRGRVHFIAPSGDVCSSEQGRAFIYFGDDDGRARFTDVFGRLGAIVRLDDLVHGFEAPATLKSAQ